MKKIPLTQYKFAIVDDEDYENLITYKWCASRIRYNGNFYALTSVYSKGKKEKNIFMHRLIMNTQKGLDTDHINHDTLDNRKRNLRTCTRSQNSMNAKKRSNNTSGTIGVSWKTAIKKWRAQIMVNKNTIHIGCFTNKQARCNKC